MWNHYSGRRRCRRARQGYHFEKAITFDLTVGSPPNFYTSFWKAVFLGVDVESLIGEVEGLSCRTRVPVRKVHNFWSDRWIAPKFLHEFPDDVFLGIDVELILGEPDISSRQTRVPVRKGQNFWSDRWIAIKFLQEFPDAVFLGVDVESLRWRFHRARPEYRFERAITFDPTVGSPLKFYMSFRSLFFFFGQM
jgi:hypothetical protein